MFAKSTFLLAAFAGAVQLVSAQMPPACLLAAINTNPNPADVKTICGKSSAMNDALNSDCGDNVKAAKDAFNAVCKNAGVQVTLSGGPSSASGNAAYPSSSSTMTYTSHYYDTSCSCTQTATLTTTANVGTGMATATGGSGNQTVATTTGGASGASATGGSSSGGSSSGGSGSSGASSTGANAASQTGGASHMVGFSLGAIAVAGLAVAL